MTFVLQYKFTCIIDKIFNIIYRISTRYFKETSRLPYEHRLFDRFIYK